MPTQPLCEDRVERAAVYSSREYFDMLVFEKKEALTPDNLHLVMKLLGMQWTQEVFRPVLATAAERKQHRCGWVCRNGRSS